LFSEQEQSEDRLAFVRMRDDKDLWLAFQRLIAKMDRDTIEIWRRENKKKAWLNGACDALKEIIPNIEQMATDAQQMEEEAKHEEEIMRSPAADGLGSGDLAIS